MTWVAAGTAAVTVVGGAINAHNANKGSKTTSEPKWLQDSERGALDRASSLSTRPYTPYEGQRTAGISGNERTASTLARAGSDEARSMFEGAKSQLTGIEDYSGSALEKYQNPYVESVLQPQLREQNLAYDKGRTSLLNSKAGAFGGDRAALEESALDRNHLQQISDTTGKVYSDAFQNAQQAFFQDQNKKLSAAQAYDQVGGDMSQLNRSQIQDLMATGGVERTLKQANLDFDYQQFLENRDWDVNNLKPWIDTIQAVKGGNSTTTETGPASGGWGQALGAASAIAGAYFTANPKTPQPVSGGGGGSIRGAV